MSPAPVPDDLRPRPPDRLSRGALLAVIAHVGLIVALSVGVSWRTAEPEGAEAELWAAVPRVAAPRAVEPDPAPPPPPPPEPAPPAPEPPPPPPVAAPPPPPPPPSRDADIAREKREEELRLQRRAEQEKREAERKEKERLEAQQREAEKREAEKREAERREAQRKQLEEKKRAEAIRKKEAERQARLEAERQAKEEAERNERIEAQRKAALERIVGQANATGSPGSPGTAAQSAGPSAGYAGRIKARIKPNVVFTETVPGNPQASVEVQVAPDGTITGRRLVKSSGVPAWDEAVLRAIDKTGTLPRDTDGSVPPVMAIEFRPRDL